MDRKDSLVIPKTILLQCPDGTVQELPLDTYVRGVLSSEMGMRMPRQAAKARAIAARSYAATGRRHARDGFDLCATAHCLEWTVEKPDPDIEWAVTETIGLVITQGDRIVATPSFDHCDGRTRNSEEVWSGKISFCRSVPCICGHTALSGHGVGMCLQGAATMASEGATAEEILKHYYAGIEILRATTIDRSRFRQSTILGQVVNSHGVPHGGVGLTLRGPEGLRHGEAARDGRFWFSELPAGNWELQAESGLVCYGGIHTDGRNTVKVRAVVPDALPRLVEVIPLGHPVELAGSLGCDGVAVSLTNPSGDVQTVLSGSASQFGPGGFRFPVPEPGVYMLRFLDQSHEVEIGGVGLWMRFVAEPE